MGIMAFISEKREKFRQQRVSSAGVRTMSDLEKLDKVRAERVALQKKSDVGNALREEKAQVRQLKTEKLRRGLGVIKEGLAGLKGVVEKHKKSKAVKGAFSSPFGGGPSVGSPSIGSGGGFSLSASKPVPKRSRDVVIRIQR